MALIVTNPPVPPSPVGLYDSASVQFLPSGTGAPLTSWTVAAKLNELQVSAADSAAATVTAKIDAVIAGASGRIVYIPPTMGAGEATTYPVGTAVIDTRAGTALSGAKIVLNGSDANGHTRFLVLDDQTSPTLSNAAAIFSHRPTGTLPANKTGEGAQIIGQSIGALSNSPAGYTLSGVEGSVVIASTGQTIPNAYGITANSQTAAASTTNVTNLVSLYAQAPAKNGTGVITNAYTIVAEDPGSIGATSNYSIWSKGAIRSNGDITLARAGVSSSSSMISGGAGNYYFLDIGRTAGDLRLAVAGATNDFINGTAAGDAIMGTPSSGSTWLQAAGVGIAKITATLFSLQYPLRLADDDLGFQTAASLYAGAGAPNNANGNNGDFYFQGDGTVAGNTVMYHKQAGAWVAFVTA